MIVDRVLSLTQILPPSEPLRQSMTDEGLELLRESIAHVGLLQPLLVKPWEEQPEPPGLPTDKHGVHLWLDAGYKVEIIDGHRRFICLKELWKTEARCTILTGEDCSHHAAMLHANIMREDVTPAEEGWQFLELAEKHGWSLGDLMKTFRVSEAYINARVDLVRADAAVSTAVHERKLNLAQAQVVIREKDTGRRAYLLEQAITMGATAKQLQVMRGSFAKTDAEVQGQLAPHTPPAAVEAAPVEQEPCVWCGSAESPEHLRQVHVHWYHKADLLAVLEKVGLHNLLATPPAPRS